MNRAFLCLLVLVAGCDSENSPGRVRRDEAAAKRQEAIAQPKERIAQRQAGIVYLDRSSDWTLLSTQQCAISPLVREFFRQAVLLSARDELGLATRDAWLGDAMPSGGSNEPFDLVARLKEPFAVELVRGVGPTRTVLASQVLDNSVRVRHGVDYCGLVAMGESLSRTTYVAALKKAGYRGRANRRDESVPLPAELERLLGEINFLSQFHAVRELHELVRSKGESTALVGGLVRGYANLGVLTEFYWQPAHKVFKARALLYAQRMVARDAASPAALWHRSYAAALAGLHEWALATFEQAGQARQAIAEKSRPPMPQWAQLVGPLCRYDVKELAGHVNDPDLGQLAALLRFLAVDQTGARTWATQTALETLEKIPECYRVHDTLCEYGGVSISHSATLTPVKLAGETIYGRLEPMPGLPDKVSGVIAAKRLANSWLWRRLVRSRQVDFTGEFIYRRALMDALTASEPAGAAGGKDATAAEKRTPSADCGEPSWAALGWLIRDLSFVQVCRRAYFQRNIWGVSADDWLAESAPLVEGHPYRPFVQTCAWSKEDQREAAARLDKVDISGSDLAAYLLYYHYSGDKKSDRSKQFYRNEDFVVRDFVKMLSIRSRSRNPNVGFVKWLSQTLLLMSPHSPMARTELVRFDWESSQSQVAQWEAEAGQYPALLVALAARHTEAGRYADAERSLKAAVKTVPGNVSYWRQLASVYQLQGQTDRWLATLEEYLQKPDYGLSHYSVRSEIANYFMNQKQWEKALPYAEGAAESYSGWGLLCAARCYEGLERWNQAEKYCRACSERYEGSSFEWYYFCRRTGHGDVVAARDFAQSFIDKGRNAAYEPGWFDLATFYRLEEQPQKALTAIDQTLSQQKREPSSCDLLWAAAIADLAKDAKKRDARLQQVKTLGVKLATEQQKSEQQQNKAKSDKPAPADGGASIVADLIALDLTHGGKGEIDLDALEKRSVALDPWFQAWFCYFLGEYLDARGQHEAADRCWKRCMSWPAAGGHRTISGAMLLKHGIKPADYRELLPPEKAESKEGATEKTDTNKEDQEGDNGPAR